MLRRERTRFYRSADISVREFLVQKSKRACFVHSRTRMSALLIGPNFFTGVILEGGRRDALSYFGGGLAFNVGQGVSPVRVQADFAISPTLNHTRLRNADFRSAKSFKSCR